MVDTAEAVGVKQPQDHKPKKPKAPKPKWATSADIKVVTHRDILLQAMDRMVRVRMFDDVEAAELGLIPDVQAFSDIMAGVQGGRTLDSDERRLMAVEKVRYMAAIAHRCVVGQDTDLTSSPRCEDCGADHPESLWTTAQARRLDFDDLNTIASVAEDQDAIETVAPLSEAPTGDDSSQPASTGAQIPQTNLDSEHSITDMPSER